MRSVDWRRQRANELRGTLERRRFDAATVELREQPDGALRLTGYASVTGVDYEVGYFLERINRGAFKRTLSENPDVQLLVNHEGLPLARTRSGTLALAEDDRGLSVDATLDPDDPDVQSLARKMRRGDVDGMSMAFQITDQDWNADYTERTIRSVSLHRGDVSVVNQGANEHATATVRARQAARASRQPLVDPAQLARERLIVMRASPRRGRISAARAPAGDDYQRRLERLRGGGR